MSRFYDTERREKEENSIYIQRYIGENFDASPLWVTCHRICSSVCYDMEVGENRVRVFYGTENREEKNLRYIQEASAPAAEPCIRSVPCLRHMYTSNSVNHDLGRVISHVDCIEGEPCDRLRYREKREICVSRVSLCSSPFTEAVPPRST